MNEKISYNVGMQHDTHGPFINCVGLRISLISFNTKIHKNNIYTYIYTVLV